MYLSRDTKKQNICPKKKLAFRQITKNDTKDKTDGKDKLDSENQMQLDNIQKNNLEKNNQAVQEEQPKQETKINSKNNQNDTDNESKIKQVVKGANDLSLGISIIVAVLIGLGIGYGLYKFTGYYWLVWVGLGYGVAAAILNVIKAYKKLHKDLDSLKDDKKYQYMLKTQNKEDKNTNKHK